MTDSENIFFKTLAAKYLWWVIPDEAIKRPERIVVQVMNLGDFADVTAVLDAVGKDQAPNSSFTPRRDSFLPVRGIIGIIGWGLPNQAVCRQCRRGEFADECICAAFGDIPPSPTSSLVLLGCPAIGGITREQGGSPPRSRSIGTNQAAAIRIDLIPSLNQVIP